MTSAKPGFELSAGEIGDGRSRPRQRDTGNAVLAYVLLVLAGITLKISGLRALKRIVVAVPARSVVMGNADSARDLCALVDAVAVYLPTRAQCLQRSAAKAMLLRCAGYAATVTIGCRRVPFRSHAWVECGSAVVSDDARYTSLFGVVARF